MLGASTFACSALSTSRPVVLGMRFVPCARSGSLRFNVIRIEASGVSLRLLRVLRGPSSISSPPFWSVCFCPSTPLLLNLTAVRHITINEVLLSRLVLNGVVALRTESNMSFGLVIARRGSLATGVTKNKTPRLALDIPAFGIRHLGNRGDPAAAALARFACHVRILSDVR